MAEKNTIDFVELFGADIGASITKKKEDGCHLFQFCRKQGGGEVGVVRMKEPMSHLYNYFEIEIVDEGRSKAIGIGVGVISYPLLRMPGWNRESIGYHADDGKLFHQAGWGAAFGPVCKKGDRMGVGIDYEVGRGERKNRVWFTRNGEMVGHAVDFQRPMKGHYPLIGLHSEMECVKYLGHSYRPPLSGDSHIADMIVNCSPLEVWARSNGIQFGENPHSLIFQAANKDVAIAISNTPMDPQNCYFEVSIDDSKGQSEVGIGLGPYTYILDSYPGWKHGSIGYHADNGMLYQENGYGKPFGPTCQMGDVMGCGVRFTEWRESHQTNEDDCEEDEKQLLAKTTASFKSNGSGQECVIYFTKNGKEIGESKMVIPQGGFYPMVAMSSAGEKVTVHFNATTG